MGYRVKRAKKLLELYARSTSDSADDIPGVLADLMHYCDQHGINYAEQDELAHGHYRAEKDELL